MKRYTSAPDAKQEDFCLPYFLKDDEKYVDLMTAVASILRAFPESVTRKHWSDLNEAYHQVTHGPHPYEGAGLGLYTTNGMRAEASTFLGTPGECVWCQTSVSQHR